MDWPASQGARIFLRLGTRLINGLEEARLLQATEIGETVEELAFRPAAKSFIFDAPRGL